MESLLRSAEGDSRRFETAEKAVGESYWDWDCDEKKAMVPLALEGARKREFFGLRTPAKALAAERIAASTTIQKIEEWGFLVVGKRLGNCNDNNCDTIIRPGG